MLQETHIMETFSPHKVCWLERWDLIWMHAVGDGLTALAYFCIPLTLVILSRKYRMGWQIKFIFCTYAGFIFLCGGTHLLDVIMIWHISENLLRFDGILRVLTGLFSFFSAFVTFWGAALAFENLGQYIRFVRVIRNERREKGRISEEKWNRFETLIDAGESLLKERAR